MTTGGNKNQAEIRMALELHRGGAVKEAAAIYQTLLKKSPQNFDLNHYLGMALIQMGKAGDAVPKLRTAVRLNPSSAAALSNLAVAYQSLNQMDDAIAIFDKIIALKPELHDPHARKAALYYGMGKFEEAAKSFQTALEMQPSAPMYNDYGVTLRELERLDDALAALDRAVEFDPKQVMALINRGNVLRDLKRPQEAIESYDKALAVDPHQKEALANKARATEEAFGTDGLQEAAALRAAAQEAAEKEASKKDVRYVEDALLKYAHAFVKAGGANILPDARLYALMQMSDWSEFDTLDQFLRDVRARKTITSPFTLIGLPTSPEDQMLCAQHYAESLYPPRNSLWTGERYEHDKIRIAYLSSDFHNHATAFLMAGMFEHHDKSKFHVTGLSAGIDDNSAIRERLKKAFDVFVDVREMSDEEVSKWVRKNEIDILIDLKGYTRDNRFGILSRRCAPVQITYIGYPGTLGSPCVDYAIADEHVVPPSVLEYFTEKVIFMPDTYQVNDKYRKMSDTVPTRTELGLPEDKFVFCSFNQTYKMTPDMFDVWMRILKRVPDSVLWMYSISPAAIRNLTAEAEKRGVDGKRLIFAGFAVQADHLARIARADLCLDNIPCNGHTTTSDALWAGLPVLTCPGPTFAGRVASSLLSAIDMPELIRPTLADYEEEAVRLATQPDVLKALRDKLVANKETTPLFNTALFTKNIEKAYEMAYERQRSGLAPEHFHVPAQG